MTTVTKEEINRARNIRHRRNAMREKEMCEKSFAQFVRCAWHEIQPAVEIQWNWHHDYLCNMLQEAMERIGNKQPRKYRYRITNVCPSSTKSFLFTRMANAWAWIHWPWMRFISSSYSSDLSYEHSGDTRAIIKSEWYQNYWGNRFSLLKYRDAISHFENDKGGMRAATSTGAKVTGRHAHIIINDDPLSAEMAESDQERMVANRFCIRTLDSRLLQNGEFWYVMQRLAEDDPVGTLLKKQKNDCKHVCIPAELRPWVKPATLKRYYKDGLFWPDNKEFSKDELEAKKNRDPLYYACQYLQQPYQEEGGLFKRKNWVFWRPYGSDPADYPPVQFNVENQIVSCDVIELPRSFPDMINTWDFSFKDKESNDPVAGFPMAQDAAHTYILPTRKYGRMNYAKSCEEMISLHQEYPLASNIVIEDKALGTAIIQDYQKQIPGIYAMKAQKGDSPHTRAVVASRYHKSKNLVLPHPKVCPWALEVVDEHTMYREGATNDQVTAISQGLVFLKNFHPVFPKYKRRTVKIEINWRAIDYAIYSLYISQWVDQDSSSSIIIAAYNSRIKKLGVIGEFIMSTNDPQLIKPIITTLITRYTGGMITKLDRFEWVGSPNMFGRATAESTKLSRAHLQREGMWDSYSRADINLVDNMSFEEAGAILHMNQMILDNAVIVDEKAPETDRQCAAWSYEGDKPSKVGFGCARALINIVNLLNDSGKLKTNRIEKVVPAYSEKREKLYEKYDIADKMGALGDLVGGKPELPKDGNSWMLL